MLSRFFKLALPRFSEAPGKYAFEFLITYEDRLHNLGKVKTHNVDYTTL